MSVHGFVHVCAGCLESARPGCMLCGVQPSVHFAVHAENILGVLRSNPKFNDFFPGHSPCHAGIPSMNFRYSSRLKTGWRVKPSAANSPKNSLRDGLLMDVE